MKWARPVLEEMTTRIAQMGLDHCSVCGTGTLGVLERPIVANMGGIPGGKSEDSGTNILFWIGVECSVCGHVMLFESQQHISGSTPALEPEAPKS